jgi:hypothetical protein
MQRPEGGRRREWCRKEKNEMWGIRLLLWVGGLGGR